MLSEIVVAICSLVGTLAGTFLGSKLTQHRIEQLEKKVDKHNCLVERMAVAERDQHTLFAYKDDHEKRIRAIENEA